MGRLPLGVMNAGDRCLALLVDQASTKPEPNPVEYLCLHWKQRELSNFCPQTFGELSHQARRALGRMRRRPTLVMGLLEQAARPIVTILFNVE